MKVSVSFLKSNVSDRECLELISKTDADFIHVDIMDGKFVPREVNNDLDLLVSKLKGINKPLDIHLMCENPKEYIEKLSVLNPEFITVHAEIDNLEYYLNLIKEKGIKSGIALNPETSEKIIDKYDADLVLIMGVNPGFGGQPMIMDVLNKIPYLKEKGKFVSIDGGVNSETRLELDSLDMVVAGYYVCSADNYQERVNSLR